MLVPGTPYIANTYITQMLPLAKLASNLFPHHITAPPLEQCCHGCNGAYVWPRNCTHTPKCTPNWPIRNLSLCLPDHHRGTPQVVPHAYE